MDGPAIRLDGVIVRYRLSLERGVSLKELVVRRRRRTTVEHEALKGVDLTVARGESLGVIGPNGAGKTTLLKLMARVLDPSSGRVRIHGTVAPLIDLFGASHHELTGRENAFLNGALLGLSRREMHERIDEITAFAEVGEFIDAPLRTYSAGMMARLAFATATTVDADIVLVDEALSVGDASFQRKSTARIEALRSRGSTFVFVSHDVHRLSELCERIVWLDGGRIVECGPGAEVVGRYLGRLR